MSSFDHRDVRIVIDAMSEYRYGIVDKLDDLADEERENADVKKKEYEQTISKIDRIRKDLRVIGDEINPLIGKYN